jgi:hypothetical protein
MFSKQMIAQLLHTFICHICDSKKRRLRQESSKAYQAFDTRTALQMRTRIEFFIALWSHQLPELVVKDVGSLRLIAASRRRVQRRAFTLTRPLRPQGFKLIAVLLTRSHPSRCIQPVKGLRCGLRRTPLRPPLSEPGFCGGTAQEGAAYQRGECLCPVLSWVTACR